MTVKQTNKQVYCIVYKRQKIMMAELTFFISLRSVVLIMYLVETAQGTRPLSDQRSWSWAQGRRRGRCSRIEFYSWNIHLERRMTNFLSHTN